MRLYPKCLIAKTNGKIKTWRSGVLIGRSRTKKDDHCIVGWGTICYKPEGRGFESRWGHRIVFNLPNPSSRTMALGLTQPLTEMNTTNYLCGVKTSWQPHRHLWADCLDNVGSSTSHNLTGLHVLLRGWLYYYYYYHYHHYHHYYYYYYYY
jgi:hypothetical protein